MRQTWKKRVMSLTMASVIAGTSVLAMSGCGSSKDEVITLDVYNQLANYSGLQAGWMADILLKKFNVKIKITPDADGTFETRMESGNLGDIVIWGGTIDQYTQAVNNKMLYNLEEDDLLKENAPYITKNMKNALQKNKDLTSELTKGKDKSLYGWGNEVATSNEDHKAFIYTWDTRWDLYKQMGYPKINNLSDFKDMLKEMQKLCPKDDSGSKTYAVSLWPDWDDTMVMYAKSTASAFYGYDELGMGLYDPTTGTYHDALEDNGPYIEMLKFYNDLYQDGLLDPDSMTQTYDQMIEKVQNGGVLFSIFNYSGQAAYNTKDHKNAGKYMYTMKPEEAAPIVYGMNTMGGDYITSIGAKTEYPELCAEVLNYFCTPDGFLEMTYGPKGENWDYDEDGNTYFTDQGDQCNSNMNTKMKGHKGSYKDGMMQMAVSTWAKDAQNPNSNGETYNSDNWKSRKDKNLTDIEKDWVDKNGAEDLDTYFDQRKFTLAPGTSYTQSSKSSDLKVIWKQVSDEITQSSWNAIYSKTNAEFNKVIESMKKKADSYGYDTCIKWCKDEAAKRHELELKVTQ